jgi:hypothetical protein
VPFGAFLPFSPAVMFMCSLLARYTARAPTCVLLCGFGLVGGSALLTALPTRLAAHHRYTTLYTARCWYRILDARSCAKVEALANVCLPARIRLTSLFICYSARFACTCNAIL